MTDPQSLFRRQAKIPLATAGAVTALRRQRRTQEHIAGELAISKASVSRILTRRGLSLLTSLEPQRVFGASNAVFGSDWPFPMGLIDPHAQMKAIDQALQVDHLVQAAHSTPER